ncbi:hypothetical protein [Longibaculum muris]|nr:hypothetical protein [Longibaculum muris]
MVVIPPNIPNGPNASRVVVIAAPESPVAGIAIINTILGIPKLLF